MAENEREWVVIATTSAPDEAMAWRDLLQGTGLDVQVSPDIDHVEMFAGAPMSDAYELMVPAEQAEQARAEFGDITGKNA
jgi:hypothetical protein